MECIDAVEWSIAVGFAIAFHYALKWKLEQILLRRSIRKQNRLRYRNIGA